jgi:hypothetical protein
MKKISAFIAMSALVAFSSMNAMAMNGMHACVLGTNHNPGDTLILSTIQNNAVSGSPTIIKGSFEGPPCFSFDGTKLACYRQTGSTWYVSVMDVATKVWTDLASCSATPSTDMAGHIRWPCGSRIYYLKPGTKQIWRTNSGNPTQTEQVADYSTTFPNNMWGPSKWDLTADTHRALIESWGSAGSARVIHNFPPVGSARVAPSFIFDLPNCNTALSPSGTYAERLWDGMHDDMIIYKYNATLNTYEYLPGVGNCGNPNSPGTICVGTSKNLEIWSGQPCEQSERPEWAVNSDRWICAAVSPGGYGYVENFCNSMVFSFKDKVAFRVTNNPTGRATWAGSLFIEGGPANSYQALDGTWVGVSPTSAERPAQSLTGIQSRIARITIEGRDLRVAVNSHDAYRISVLDARGRTVGSIAGNGVKEYDFGTKALKAGLYFVKVRTGGRTETASVVMQ